MLATLDRVPAEVCQEDLREVFLLVAEKIEKGEAPNYSIYHEKSSDSKILMYHRTQHSNEPVAVLAKDKVGLMPPPLNPLCLETAQRMEDLDVRLRLIGNALTPA